MAAQKEFAKPPTTVSPKGSEEGRNDQGPLRLHEVLEEEYERLHGPLPLGYVTANPSPEQRLNAICSLIHALEGEDRRAALCISGGGIRSATFALGILQGLARSGLLGKFHYLSTVSGGGYIGGWLTAWIKNHKQGLDGVIRELQNTDPHAKVNPEPAPVRHLRSYSNYLSPKLGLLSADTWTLVGTVFRNLILIWLVMVPLIAAFLMIPRIAVAVVDYGYDKPQAAQALPANAEAEAAAANQPVAAEPATAEAQPPAADKPALRIWRWALFIVGTLFAIWALVYMGLHRPSTTHSRAGQGSFLIFCFTPLFLSSAALTTFWIWNRLQPPSIWSSFRSSRIERFLQAHHIYAFLTYGLVIGLLSSFIYLALLWRAKKKGRQRESRPVNEILGHGFTGMTCGWLLWFVAEKFFDPLPAAPPAYLQPLLGYLPSYIPTCSLAIYTCLASPAFFLCFLLAATFFIGISSHRMEVDDEDREWWARAGAWMLIFVAVWLAFSVLIIFGPSILQTVWTTVIGGLSGLVTIAVGRSPKTDAKKKEEDGQKKKKWAALLTQLALAMTAPLFVAFLIIVVSAATSWLIYWLSTQQIFLNLLNNGHGIEWGLNGPAQPESLSAQHLKIVNNSPFWFVGGVMAIVAAFGLLMARVIDTNKFSLHAMYRNRLIRAYLGASNPRRDPNRFTGFDKHDNIRMHQVWPITRPEAPAEKPKLLPVVNMALNLVSGDNLAWQERKAQSFTVSPLHAGSFQLIHAGPCQPDQKTNRCRRNHLGYYRRASSAPKAKRRKSHARYYGGKEGISLGTAVTISGAAASPNMGYHSSPAITFLLTLFNARLGWWLGNPGPKGEDTYDRNAPQFAFGPFVEALGFTNANRPYVYLSDGGHFENLGLYEMVLRRCHFIVVSDASQDEACKFQDLGGAVRKIRIDLGIPIEFDEQFSIFARSTDQSPNDKGCYCAIGRIRYSCAGDKVDGKDAPDGVLIYIKPAFYGVKEPRDVYEYAMTNKKFPHEPTTDQFFTESQFESYRILGSHIMERICGADHKVKDFDELKSLCEKHLCLTKPEPGQPTDKSQP